MPENFSNIFKPLLLLSSLYLLFNLYGCSSWDANKVRTEKSPSPSEKVEKQPRKPIEEPDTRELDLPLKPGLENLGNTCFANATTVLLFEIAEFGNILKQPLKSGQLTTLPRESSAQLQARQNFQAATLHLHSKRDTLASTKPSASMIKPELEAYLTSFEQALYAINGSELVGGSDGAKLRSQQGDAFDFASSVLELLAYPLPALTQVIRFADGSFKGIAKHESLVSLNLASFGALNPNFSQVFTERMAPTIIEGVARNDGTIEDASQRHSFLVAPNSLILRLERFAHQTDGSQIKLQNLVAQDKELQIPLADARNLAATDRLHAYDLRAVTVHAGSSTHSGHYYTYVYEKKSKAWILYDDRFVSVVSNKTAEEDIARNGYLFLYLKH